MLISASELISQSWSFYFNGKNFKQYIPYVGLTVLLAVGIVGIPGALIYLAATSGLIIVWVVAILAVIAAFCFSIYGGLWLQVAFLKAIKNILENKSVSVKTVLKDTRKLILPYFGTSLLQAILILAGFLFFFIPAIVLSVWFCFARMVSVFEEPKEGAAALRMSKTMVAGRGWSIFWRWFASYFVAILALGIISYVISLAFPGHTEPSRMMLNSYSSGNSPFSTLMSSYSSSYIWSTRDIAYQIASNVVALIMSPLLLAIGVILYKSAKENPVNR